jgi:hypothetical protein
MSDESQRRSSEEHPATAEPVRPAEAQPVPRVKPPRPEMSDRTPPPATLSRTPTGPVKISRYLWLTSFVIGLAVLAFAFLARNDHIERLSTVIADVEPDRAAETLDTVALIVFWSSLGAIALVILIEALLERAVVRRHRWAQWAQLLVLVVHTGVVLLAGAFIALGNEGLLIAVFLVVQLLLGGMALVVSVLPGSGAWFRAKNEPDGSDPA